MAFKDKYRTPTLSRAMLKAIITALKEILAGPGPQGYDEGDEDSLRWQDDATAAQEWAEFQLERRKRADKARKRSKQ